MNMNNSLNSHKFVIRGFKNSSDFDIIANIRNKSAVKYFGKNVNIINAKTIESLISTEERVRIVELNNNPIGFVFVLKEGSTQLDEYGTVENTSWLFSGPTCLPKYEDSVPLKKLLNWLVTYAREMGISNLIRYVRDVESQELILNILNNEGFREDNRYYSMKLELNEPPIQRLIPNGFKLVDYRGEEDFDILWEILDKSFDYGDYNRERYERDKNIFKSLESAYIPICIETSTNRPIGTIAAVKLKDKDGVIATFGVIPSFQGQGFGSLLMAKALEHFWQSGVKNVDLSVRVKNPQAITVYKHFGFQVIPNKTILILKKDF